MLINIEFSTVKSNQDCNRLVSNFVKEQYKKYSENVNLFSENKIIENVLLGKGNNTEVNYLLYNFSNSQLLKSNFILLDKNKSIISTNLYKSNQKLFLANDIIDDTLVKIDANPDQLFNSVSRIQYNNGQNSDLLFAKAVIKGEKIIGYIIFDIYDSSLYNYMKNKSVDIIIIADRFDNVAFSTNSSVVDSMGKYKLNWTKRNMAKVNNKPYYVTLNKLQDQNMKILTMTSISTQERFFLFGVLLLCGVSVILIFLVTFLADKVTNRNLRSIDALLYAVNQCQKGNIDYRIESETFDEFQTVYDEFNNMMSKLQILIKNNNEIAERKRLMEVKHLEEQFNPHFVFNILETLRYEIIIDPTRASNMVVSFANLMRYSINYGSTQVLLHTDIEYVRDYLMLQKMRYNSRLEYNIQINETLMKYKIPKLLIQPIVENSITHGGRNTQCLTINITGIEVDGVMELCIEDDGQGIEEEKLNELYQMLNSDNVMAEHIGLYNAHKLIQLLYGKNYGLTIESKYGSGTKVILRIPIIEGEKCV